MASCHDTHGASSGVAKPACRIAFRILHLPNTATCQGKCAAGRHQQGLSFCTTYASCRPHVERNICTKDRHCQLHLCDRHQQQHNRALSLNPDLARAQDEPCVATPIGQLLDALDVRPKFFETKCVEAHVRAEVVLVAARWPAVVDATEAAQDGQVKRGCSSAPICERLCVRGVPVKAHGMHNIN